MATAALYRHRSGPQSEAADLILQLGRDTQRELWTDAIGPCDHRLVGTRDRSLQFVRAERRQDSQPHPPAATPDRGTQAEPMEPAQDRNGAVYGKRWTGSE